MSAGDVSDCSCAREPRFRVEMAPDMPGDTAMITVFSREQLEAVVELVARLEAVRRADEPLVGVAEVARWAGMSRQWATKNARELGGFKLGSASTAPWRFRLSEVASRFDPLWWDGWR